LPQNKNGQEEKGKNVSLAPSDLHRANRQGHIGTARIIPTRLGMDLHGANRQQSFVLFSAGMTAE